MSTMKYFNTSTQLWERVDSGAINDGTDRVTPSEIKSFNRTQMHSGFLNFQGLSDFTFSTSTLNAVTINKDLHVNLDGYYIKIPINTVIQFSAPPTTGKRNDLAYLKATFNSQGYMTGATIQVADNVSSLTGLGYTLDTVDKGLYKNGSNKSIEIFTNQRRNSSGFSPSNPNGAKTFKLMPINIVTVASGYTAQWTFVNTIDYDSVNVGDSLFSGFSVKVLSKDGSNKITISTNVGWGTYNNVNFNVVSDHPQSLYSNVIDSRDITDLRHETKAQYNYDYMLKKADDMFKRGELSAKKLLATHHGIPKTEIDVNTVFYASLDGTTVAEVGGSPASGVVSTDIKAWKPSWTGSGVQFNNKFTYPVVTTFINGLTIDFTVDLTELRAIGTTRILGGYLDGTYKFNVYFDSNDKMWISLPGATPQFVLVSGYSGKVKIRHAITNTVYNGSVNGKVLTTISNIGVSVSTISIDTVHLGSYGDGSSVTPCKAILSDVSISNIDRGSLFPNLPADFISGDAQIMPAYTVQRRILSQSQTTQTVNSIVKATNLNNSRGINHVVIGTPNAWSASDTVTVTGMAGELISGVFDTDTAICTVIKDALSTDTAIYTDVVTGLVAGDEVKLIDRVLGTVLATKTIATDGVDTTLKKITFTATLGVALSKYQVALYESTATSSSPKVYFMNGTTKTEVVGDSVTPWTGMFGNVATFKLGVNAGLVAQDIQIDYSLIMPAGQPALSVPTTLTLGGEAGFRVPYANQTIVSDYVGKVAGQTWENPNVAKTLSGIVANNPAPSTFVTELIMTEYAKIGVQDGVSTTFSTSVNGEQACVLLSFDLIKIAERKLGCKIPRKTIAEKVAWLKAGNITSITANILCNGSSPMGSKETLATWNLTTWSGFTPITSTSSSIVTLTKIVTVFTTFIDVNGFVHYTVYSDPSDGITPSTVNVDFASLDIKFADKIVICSENSIGTSSSIVLTDDFANKLKGDTASNPNIIRYKEGTIASRNTEFVPGTGTEIESTSGAYNYSGLSTLNATLASYATSTSAKGAGFIISYNAISEFEQKYGVISVLDKVAYLKSTLGTIVGNVWAYGSLASGGNSATFAVWNSVASTFTTIGSVNTTSVVTKISGGSASVSIANMIDNSGWVHFLVHSADSDGTASTIFVDYCSLDLSLASGMYISGYDILIPKSVRRDSGLANVMVINKQTKEMQTLFPWSNEYNLTTYSEYVPSPSPITSSTDVTIVSELPNWVICDIGSSTGGKFGNHPWSSLTYKVGQDSTSLYGEFGISQLGFAEESINLNTGALVNLNTGGFTNNFTKQYGLIAISKPMVGIGRWLVMYNSQLYLLVFSKLVTNGVLNTDNTGQIFLVPLQGLPLVKMETGVVRSGIVTPTTFKSSNLEIMGYVDHATRKLITTNNSI